MSGNSTKRNSLKSPLLRLPLEIRNKIWSEVLGDRLVHLNIVPYKEICPEGQEKDTFGSYFSCESDLNYGSIKPNINHEERNCGFHEMMMYLSVLRLCRQVYVEANQILWTTNTFSFVDTYTFKIFMKARTIRQKRLIKSLRLQMEWDRDTDTEWNRVLTVAFVKSVPGLRRLCLRIDRKLSRAVGIRYEDTKSKDALYKAKIFQGIHRLSTLALTDVEVVVNPPLLLQHDSMTKAGREEFAEGLRKILLNPKGAEIYAEDQLNYKEECRKKREYAAATKALISRPDLQIESEGSVATPNGV